MKYNPRNTESQKTLLRVSLPQCQVVRTLNKCCNLEMQAPSNVSSISTDLFKRRKGLLGEEMQVRVVYSRLGSVSVPYHTNTYVQRMMENVVQEQKKGFWKWKVISASIVSTGHCEIKLMKAQEMIRFTVSYHGDVSMANFLQRKAYTGKVQTADI